MHVGRSKLIQTNLIELDVELFMNSLSLVRLLEKSTFGLGLRVRSLDSIPE